MKKIIFGIIFILAVYLFLFWGVHRKDKESQPRAEKGKVEIVKPNNQKEIVEPKVTDEVKEKNVPKEVLPKESNSSLNEIKNEDSVIEEETVSQDVESKSSGESNLN